MALTKVIGNGLGTLGDGTANDTKIVFDGNAQDYHIGLDDSADTLVIGKGSALGTTTSMSFEENGIIRKPLQPSFLARKNSNLSDFAHGADITVDYNDEIFDQNADYNNSNYTFTAPVTGKYHLNARVRLTNVDTGAGYYYLQIITSNRGYINIIAPKFSSDPAYLTLVVSETVEMDASDTAYCIVYQEASGTGGQTDIQGGSTFGGYLIC